MHTYPHFRESELEQALQQLKDESGQDNLFAIIDGTNDGPALTHFFRDAPQSEYYPLFLGTELEYCLPRSPYLVDAESVPSSFIRNASDTRLNLIWFTSDWSMIELVPFWQCRMFCDLPDGQSPLFRCWNGAILNRILQFLSVEQRALFLPPTTNLVLPNQDQRWWQPWRIRLELTPDTENSMQKQNYQTWQIDNGQLRAFSNQFRDMHIRELESALWRSAPEYMQQVPPLLLNQLIEKGTHTAEVLGISSDQAIERFIKCQLQLGRDFWRKKGMENVWGKEDTDIRFKHWHDQSQQVDWR